MTFEDVVARVETVTGSAPRGVNGTRSARCPAHDDRNPSLSISIGDDGRTLLRCQAGCSVDDVTKALGIELVDLFAEPPARQSRPDITATYDYVDVDGALLFQVVRMTPKTFRQRRPDGHGDWIWNLQGVQRVLYRLPEVLDAIANDAPVFVVEGEKDVDAAWRAGYAATCNPGGAGKWRPEHAASLTGADVVVVADTDEPGRRHAAAVAASLTGVAARVHCAEPLHGKDLADHLAAGHDVANLVKVDGWAPDAPPDQGGEIRSDARVVEFIAANLHVPTGIAELLAPKVEERANLERVTGLARRLVRDETLARDADLAGIDVVNAAELLQRDRPKRRRIFGDLVLDGHNVTIVARKKAGKSTLAEEMTRAATTGGDMLGRYPVDTPLRVAYLNYELDERDEDNRIRRLDLDDDALRRLLVLNLRGRRLPLMTATGRDWLVQQLVAHRTDIVIIDPFGAAYAAAGGESENDNAEVRRFTTALDEIKRLAGVGTLVMAVHTGAAEQEAGEERARGASVLEDWPDVLMYLTTDRDHARYLRTDGRAPFRLHESRLGYDEPTGRLMLATSDLGVNRTRAKQRAAVDAVLTAIRDEPGMNSRAVRDALGAAGVTSNEQKDAAVRTARSEHLIHVHHGKNNAVLHFTGPPHDEDETCPEGWTAQ